MMEFSVTRAVGATSTVADLLGLNGDFAMTAGILLRATLFAFACIIAASPASAMSLKDYDVQKAQSWADALAICDVSIFLNSGPKLDAEVIIAAVPEGTPVALRAPLFIPPSNFYSNVMRDTFERARKSGQVTAEAYAAARYRYTKLMLAAFQGSTNDLAFLADQMRTCYALAGSARGVKPGAKS